ncbi:transglycosylase domain-containing protein [Alloprevotella sp. oral taxon 473]|uniref:transglycosylase domain-containing protein n=1 Tax=Alloprevotella sp. oral taxon 473 TaxID=712469 RepID=UPI0002A312B6|nr:transglycosylase domain-containing protein [Alloprevotella sp. oral taxon 473]EKX88306.1 transglycosylase [Alloprevotella sp. oral taxon 473 str. F0040]
MWQKSRDFGRWYRSLYKNAPWWKKIGVGFSSFIVFIIVYCLAVQFNLFWLFGKSPSLDTIMNPKTAAASEIYSADGKLLGKFFSENRTPVAYDSIAPNFFDALISTEDERFYSHHGVDFMGLGAAVKDAATGHARGASTITQQLVKNMFRVRTEYSTGLLGYIPGVKMLIMKSKEMIIATELEWFCSKQEILTMYANTVDFGSNAYGIKTAAKTYFNTTPAELKTEQSAVLVGLLKATSAYNPKTNPKNSLFRRNVVLDNMYKHGKLSAAELSELREKPIELNFSVETAYDGQALYFRQAVADEIKNLDLGLDPYKDGLKIYTTVDSRMQKYAEQAMLEQMKVVQRNFDAHWGKQDPWVNEKNQPIPGFLQEKLKQTDAYKMLSARYPDDPQKVMEILNTPHNVKLFSYSGDNLKVEREMTSVDSLRYMLRFMHAGFVAIEPQTGDVKAYVGDVDFNTWQHDNVKATHQPGSTFKLFVYATAMKQGWLPSDARLKDEYIQMNVVDEQGKPSVWRPHNANGRFSGANIPLRAAFAQSINTIAIKLGQEVGIPNVIKTAQDMGIKSKLNDAPSLPLGPSDVHLMELVGAYASVANYGEFVKPTMITRIIDREGKVVYESRKEVRTVLSDKEAFYMQTLLGAGMTDAGGTSQALASQNYIGQWFWNKRIDAGGKTGTSNSHADAWFVGVTPNLVGGAWVGGEYRQIHFRSGALGQGSKTALPIFGLFMKKVLSDAALAPKYLARYRIPEGVNPADLEGRFLYQHADSTSHDSTAVDFSEDIGASPEEHGDNPPPPAAPTHEPVAPKEPVNNTPNGTAEPVKDQGAKTGMNKNSTTIKTDRTQSSGEKKPKKKASGDDLFN